MRRGQAGRLAFALGVVCLLVILALLLLPALAPPRVQYRTSECKNRLKQLGVYLDLYRTKFHQPIPIGTADTSWFAQVWRPDLATNGDFFRCAYHDSGTAGTDYWCIVRPGTWKGFSFRSGADLTSPTAPGDLPIACDLGSEPNHPNGVVIVLRLDGHADYLFDSDADAFRKSPPSFLGSSGWDAPKGTK